MDQGVHMARGRTSTPYRRVGEGAGQRRGFSCMVSRCSQGHNQTLMGLEPVVCHILSGLRSPRNVRLNGLCLHHLSLSQCLKGRPGPGPADMVITCFDNSLDSDRFTH